ncbi:MAG: exosortase-associated EpsI family protein [Phycisphaera sp.]|nr:exosortase-associated EpsI family protein [Phycisphaera sp.]
MKIHLPLQHLDRASPWVCLAVLVGLGAVTLNRPGQLAAAAYHKRVQLSAQHLPTQLEGWRCVELPIAAEELDILKPNVMVRRAFVDSVTGRAFELTVVQCPDARHIEGHSPLICFIANGWTQRQTQTVRAQADLPAYTRYRFDRTFEGQYESLVVLNFVLLPDGTTSSDARGANAVASSLHDRWLGAAQYMLVFDDQLSEDVQQRALAQVWEASQDFVHTVASGKRGQ